MTGDRFKRFMGFMGSWVEFRKFRTFGSRFKHRTQNRTT